MFIQFSLFIFVLFVPLFHPELYVARTSLSNTTTTSTTMTHLRDTILNKKEKLKKNQSHLETRTKSEEKELAAAAILEKQKQMEAEVRLREMKLLQEEEAKINSELMRLAGEIEHNGAGFESSNETDPDVEQIDEEYDGKEKASMTPGRSFTIR